MSLPRPDANLDVLVTGASSGIGTELARGLARRGHSLVLVARRADRLEALAAELRAGHDVHVDVRACDLGDRAARAALVSSLRSSDRTIGSVCNCAGFGTLGSFVDLPLDREVAEVELNSVAIVELSHAFLADMVDRGTGALLNVASVAAFQPIPRMATYSASKAFVQTFSEALHEELRGTGVSCTVLCPGPVPTEWAEIADAETLMVGSAQVSPKQVAEDAIVGMERGKRSVLPGVVAKALGIVGRFAPRSVLLPGATVASKVLRK
jgi:short-subunit dehydrogenase